MPECNTEVFPRPRPHFPVFSPVSNPTPILISSSSVLFTNKVDGAAETTGSIRNPIDIHAAGGPGGNRRDPIYLASDDSGEEDEKKGEEVEQASKWSFRGRAVISKPHFQCFYRTAWRSDQHVENRLKVNPNGNKGTPDRGPLTASRLMWSTRARRNRSFFPVSQSSSMYMGILPYQLWMTG